MPGPVVTITSMHICPMCSGTVPHVGGPVTGPGAPNILINNKPASIMGDMCVCVGPPDTIVQGEASVFFNGTPAVCIGAMTAHGGSVTVGEPNVIISTSAPSPSVTMEEADIPFPKISTINKTLAFLSGNNLQEALKNQEKLKEPLYEELENIKLTSTFAVDQLQIMAKKDSLILFTYVIKRVFGNHYTNNTIKKLYTDAQANASQLNPQISVTKGGNIGTGGPAGYSNKTNKILVSENFARKAKDDNDARAELMVALVEEVGHHIHHLLHNVYTPENERKNLPKKNRAIGDAGAKFSYQVIQINLLETSEQYFADLEIDGAKQTLIWNCKELHNNLTQYVNQARQNRDDNGEISFYKAGKINVNHGEYGHQDIEELAMKDNIIEIYKYEKDDPKINTILHKIYLGNWMRDFSQVVDPAAVRPLANTIIKYAEKGTDIKGADLSNVTTDKPSNTKTAVAVPYGLKSDGWFSYNVIYKNLEVRPITWSREFLTSFVGILALKEFAKPKDPKDLHKENYDKRLMAFKKEYIDITPEVLGVYRPDEHIDNPKTDPIDKNAHNPDLNAPGETHGFVGQATPQELAIGKIFGMKNYIRTHKSDADSSKFSTKRTAYDFVIEQLEQAQFNHNFGNINSMLKFGAALHVIEDYFAHTNYVELAVAKVNNDRVFPWVDVVENHTPYVGAINFNYDKFAKLKPNDASAYLNLKATPSVIGISRIKIDKTLGIRPNQIVRFVPIVTGTFGDLDMLASLLPLVEEKFLSIEIKPYSESKSGERTINDVLILEICRDLDQAQGLDGNGTKDGTYEKRLNDLLEIRDGITTIKNTLPKFMRKYAHDIMERIGALINFGFYNLLKLCGSRISDAQLLLQDQIKKIDQNKGNIAIGTDPTHTQIAKDDPDKPLHQLSVKLAVIAVKRVSAKMFEVWQSKRTIQSVIDEVDHIMQHPAVTTWQDKTVLEWAKKNPKKVCNASTPSVVIDSIIHGLEEIKKFNEKLKVMAEGKAEGIVGKGFTTMESIIKEYDENGSLLKNFKDLIDDGDKLLEEAEELKNKYGKEYYKPPHCS